MIATAISRKRKTKAILTRIKKTSNCCCCCKKKILSVRWKALIQFMCIISRNGSLGCQWELYQINSLGSVKSVDNRK